MHQACKLLIRVVASNGITTVPRSRPPGRITLYAVRTSVLILSADCTVTILSEYISTASVFSSCAGTGALTSACIHAGASPANERPGMANTPAHNTDNHNTERLTSIARSRCHWLHNDLFFITCPHALEECAQC